MIFEFLQNETPDIREKRVSGALVLGDLYCMVKMHKKERKKRASFYIKITRNFEKPIAFFLRCGKISRLDVKS